MPNQPNTQVSIIWVIAADFFPRATFPYINNKSHINIIGIYKKIQLRDDRY